MPKIVAALAAVAFVWAVNAPSAAAAECETPLPEDVRIVAPGTDVPLDLARFSGAWGDGKWGGQLCNTLIVEMVAADGVIEAIYSWGEYREWDTAPGFSRISASVIDGKLAFAAPHGGTVIYWLSGRYVRGAYERGTLDVRITLVEKDLNRSPLGEFMD
jgi:hypothetical protein